MTVKCQNCDGSGKVLEWASTDQEDAERLPCEKCDGKGRVNTGKLSQEDLIIKLLRSGPKTTNEIISSPYLLAAAYRRAISDLRKQGYVITYHKGPRGTGTYTLDQEPGTPIRIEKTGQTTFI